MLDLLYVALQHAAAQAHRAHAPARAATSTGSHLPKCELALPTLQMLQLQLHNYPYIAAFAGGYWILWLLFRRSDARVFLSFVLTLLAAAGLEVAAVMTKRPPGVCRVQDLVPAVAGALGAAVLLGIWSRLRRKPAYVRLVKRPAPAGSRSAPLPPPPPSPRGGIPQRAVIYDPPPTGYAPPPPPPDFSPGPTTEVRPAAQAAPTETVAPSKRFAARAAIAQRLQPILGRIKPALQGLWASIVRRRRAVGIGLAAVVIIGAAFVLLRNPSSVPVATEQPKAAAVAAPEAPPPAPRQLQSEVEGYYEPSYQFTVADRRFTRLTLRPDASVRFSRLGSRQEVGCADARISPAAVHVRCDFEAAGIIVTIDGRFTSRYASDRLDMPPLSASITITNTRGETVYRARDSFYWHVPD